jgi:hypothetical protein
MESSWLSFLRIDIDLGIAGRGDEMIDCEMLTPGRPSEKYSPFASWQRLLMYRALFFCAACVTALAWASPGGAQEDHYYSLVSVDVTNAEFADDNALRDHDGTIRLSILRVPVSGPIAYAVSQVTLNCASLKNQLISEISYTSDGKQTVLPGEAEATAIKPGTLGDVLKRYICDGLDPYPRSKSIKGLQAAISKTQDLIAAEKNK